MASEIRVDKINSLSGVGTVTLSPTGVDIAGITTAATLKATTGIVTTLTATTGIVTSLEATTGDITTLRAPTGIVTSLIANTARATTGIVTTLTATTGIVTSLTTNTLTANSTAKVGSGVTLSPDGDVFVTGVTTSSTVKVGAAVTISESGIEATGVGITVANINGGQIGGRRNIVINGSMQVAQRGTSSSSDGYQTVDRFKFGYGGENEAPVQYQGALTSSDTGPYGEGHRYAYYVQNGNQTGGAGSADYAEFQYKAEAQDIANCGWNYTSSSNFITLSFWVKSSVAQNFYGFVYSADGTAQRYIFETGTLTANQWKKVVVVVPGGTNVQFDNNVNEGFIIKWIPFYGTDKTNNSATTGSWANYNGAARCPDYTSTWWTTDNSTFWITGVQLEVGSQATPYEHRNFGEELQLCKRYYQQINQESSGTSIITGFGNGTARLRAVIPLMVEMRVNPTVALDVSGGNPSFYSYAGSPPSYSSLSGVESTKKTITVDINTSTVTAGAPYDWRGSGAFITIAAEL